MRKLASQLTLLATLLVAALLATPAHAQATRTWVSGVGDDANPCSRTAPCKTFAGAISRTAAGGEINCIDPGGFGAVTITKSITIDCTPVEAGVLVAGTNGIVVAAGASDVINLRWLDFFGVPGALNGIQFNSGAALSVEQCRIRNFSVGFGINVTPSSGTSELYVTDTMISNNGSGSAGGAINIKPTGSGAVVATIHRTRALNNISGFTADTSAPTSGNVLVAVHDSISSGNTLTGFSVVSGTTGSAELLIDRSASEYNATGISASGTKAAAVLGLSTVFQNSGTGLLVPAGSGGQILSYGNNQVVSNTPDGAPTGPLTPK